MDIHSIKIKAYEVTMHIMHYLSHHLRKQASFSHHLRKNAYKGRYPRGNSKPAYLNMKGESI